VVRLGGKHRRIDVINATSNGEVVLSPAEDLGTYRYTIRDCQGRQVKAGQVALRKRVAAFTVPPSGLLALERI
jgi:hypothetical protein